MPNTDLQLLALEIKQINDMLSEHGEILKHLAANSTIQAVQTEQLRIVMSRVDAMYVHVDNIKNHQAQCPQGQISKIWWAIGSLFTSFIAYAATMHK